MRDRQRQMRAGQRVGDEDEREDRHDVAEGAARRLQHDDGQHRAGEGRHPGRLAQTLGQVMYLVHRHDHGNPCEDDEADVEHAAGGTERLAARELILEAMLVERLGQQDQRQREGEVDTALRDIVVQAVEAGPDVEQGHAEGKHSGSLDEDVALALLQGLRRGKLTVERGDVDLLDFVFLFLISHISSPFLVEYG